MNAWIDPWGLVEVLHFPDFDSARRAAFDIASGGDPNIQFTPTKVDPITGTEVEFKGANGAKIAYDSAHPDMDFTKGHDKPHIGVQTQGKRSDGEVRGLILPMMVTPTLIDLPRRVRV